MAPAQVAGRRRSPRASSTASAPGTSRPCEDISEHYRVSDGRTLYFFLGASVLVLVLTIVNVAGLTLSRERAAGAGIRAARRARRRHARHRRTADGGSRPRRGARLRAGPLAGVRSRRRRRTNDARRFSAPRAPHRRRLPRDRRCAPAIVRSRWRRSRWRRSAWRAGPTGPSAMAGGIAIERPRSAGTTRGAPAHRADGADGRAAGSSGAALPQELCAPSHAFRWASIPGTAGRCTSRSATRSTVTARSCGSTWTRSSSGRGPFPECAMRPSRPVAAQERVLHPIERGRHPGRRRGRADGLSGGDAGATSAPSPRRLPADAVSWLGRRGRAGRRGRQRDTRAASVPGRNPIGRQIELKGARTTHSSRPASSPSSASPPTSRSSAPTRPNSRTSTCRLPSGRRTDLELIVRGNGDERQHAGALRAAAANGSGRACVRHRDDRPARVTAAFQRDRFNLALVAGFAVVARAHRGDRHLRRDGVRGDRTRARIRCAHGAWREPGGPLRRALWYAARLGVAGAVLGVLAAIGALPCGSAMRSISCPASTTVCSTTSERPIRSRSAPRRPASILIALCPEPFPRGGCARIDPVKTLRAE